MAWLGATSMHSRDFGTTEVAALLGLLGMYKPLHVVVNHFDAGGPPTSWRAPALEGRQPWKGDADAVLARLSFTWVSGMKGLFWKRVLGDDRLRGVRLVWLFDADVATHPAVMPLGELAGALLPSSGRAILPDLPPIPSLTLPRLHLLCSPSGPHLHRFAALAHHQPGALLSTNASAMQPVIRSKGLGTDHTWLRQRPSLSSCVASTARFVEVMTPLLQVDAWRSIHKHLLTPVPDDALEVSDFGIDVTWFARLSPSVEWRVLLTGVAIDACAARQVRVPGGALPGPAALPRTLFGRRDPLQLQLDQAVHERLDHQAGAQLCGHVPLHAPQLQALLHELLA